MARDEQIAELLIAWEEARQRGEPVSAEELCRDAPELIDEVQRRLAILGAMQSALALDTVDERTSIDGRYGTPGPTFELPGFDYLGDLGVGGMGVVFKARQLRLGRVVAIKMLRARGLTADQLERLQTEAEAAARLNHPGIVAIHEIGEHDGCPFLVLEYVDGGTLTRRIASATLSPDGAARLITAVAEAVQVAHEAGVIHRDLKPANVLLTTQGEPKIADFGLARRVDDDSRLTRTGDVIGTPCYMAPEQARGDTVGIGVWTDIYALGATLYETLTGRPPFKGATQLETLRQVDEADPIPPSRLQPGIPRDLETVCLKCLEKEPTRRYASAGQLALDLRRFRNGEPVLARPLGRLARGWRWVRRNPLRTGLLVTGAIALLLAVGLLVGNRYQRRLEDSLEREQQLTADLKSARERIAQTNYLKQVAFAQTLWRNGDVARARTVLDRLDTSRRGWEWRYVHRLCHAEAITFRGHADGVGNRATGVVVTALAFSRDGRQVASGDNRGVIHVWEAETGRVIKTLNGLSAAVSDLSFAPNNARLAGVSAKGVLKVWNVKDGTAERTISISKSTTSCLDWNRDGTRLACGGEGGVVRVWNAGTGRIVHKLSGPADAVRDVAFSADGTLVAAVTSTKVGIWEVASGRPRATHTDGPAPSPGDCIAFEGATHRVVTIARSSVVRLHKGEVWKLAISRDGTVFADGGSDRTVQIQRWPSSAPITLRGHTGTIVALALSTNGRRLASGGMDGLVKVWDANVNRRVESVTTRPFPFFPVTRVRFRANKSLIWAGGSGAQSNAPTPAGFVASGEVRSDRGHDSRKWPERVEALAVHRKRDFIALADREGELRLLHAKTLQTIRRWKAHPAAIRAVGFDPAGHRLATAGADRSVRIWKVDDGKLTRELKGHTDRVTSVAFDPAGRYIATGCADTTVRIWNAATGRLLRNLRGHDRQVRCVAFNHDGSQLATGGDDGVARIWNPQTGDMAFQLLGHTGPLTGVAFSPDGRRLATAGEDGTVRLWDPRVGEQSVVLGQPGGSPYADVVFSPGGKRIAAAGVDVVHVWSTE